MTEIADQPADPDLAAAVWDLGPLNDGQGDNGITHVLEELSTATDVFTSRFSGRVAELEAAELVVAARQLERIRALVMHAESYAALRGAADGADPSASALQGQVEQAKADTEAALVFFELEWTGLADAVAEARLDAAGDELAFAAHHLRRLRARRPHLLSPEQEQILAETSVPRVLAWRRLYLESTARLTVELDGEPAPLFATAVAGLVDPDRDRRLAVSAAVAEGVRSELPTRVSAYNQMLGEKAVDDRLRGFPTWLSARNLENETTDAAVDTQLAAISDRADLVRRWYRLKAKLLGLERLSASDLWAPLPGGGRNVPYAQARDVICAAWSAFSPRAGEIVAAFFSEGRIDAPARANKQGGAFCCETGPEHPPYILTNYESRPYSLMTLAHELGHGLHFELARSAGALQYVTSIPLIEVASTFSEALVAEHLLSEISDDAQRLEILAAQLDGAALNVFESSSQHRGEAAMHTFRRERGELSAEDIDALWRAAHVELWQDTVEPDPGYLSSWAFIPHMTEPGYLYSYSYGLLTAWSAFARYRQVGEAFSEDYLTMLTAGGSARPVDLIALIGLDAEDPGFWNAGLDQFAAMLAEAEGLAGR